jgi:hypothetical protein
MFLHWNVKPFFILVFFFYRKVVNVPPYACSTHSPTYSNVCGVTEQPTNDDVYNHMHEKEKVDVDDDYDHAAGIACHVTEHGNFSHLQSSGGT